MASHAKWDAARRRHDLVSDHIPAPTAADYDKAFDVAQHYLFSLGITGWQDAIVGEVNGRPDNHEAYLRAAADDRLKARVVGALWWDRTQGDEQIEQHWNGDGRDARVATPQPASKSCKTEWQRTSRRRCSIPTLIPCGDHASNSGISFVDPEHSTRTS